MADPLTALFADFDNGTISRRHLLRALGLAAVAVPAGRLLGQGTCGGNNATSARCDTIPLKAPFEPTGWKTVILDHFSMSTVDYEKEAAFFSQLMGWKVRSDDGTKAVLDIGDWGGIVIRGGITPPPAPTPDTGGRGGGAGNAGAGGANGRGGRGPRVARAVVDGMCWGIEPWDTKKVEAELQKRGLNPVADHDGEDFYSFHVKDPDGFDVQVSNGNKKNRRTTPATGTLKGPMPFEPTGWKSLYLDHISFGVTNYKESTAFYAALLGWKPKLDLFDENGKKLERGDISWIGDEGSENECQIAPTIGDVIIRGGGATTTPPANRHATIDHISFGIADFDPDKVQAELQKRSLPNIRADTGGKGDIHEAHYKSYHVGTPNGWNLQISNLTHAYKST